MQNFNEISLGFAEFVAQLLQETFDAALSAQNHQIERYAELTNILNLSASQYSGLYLTNQDLLNKELELFGLPLKEEIMVTEEMLDRIENLVEDTSDLIKEERLTSFGVSSLKDITLEITVEEKKSILREIINKTEMTRLHIDSGEIKAKLELSNLYQSVEDEGEGEEGRQKANPLREEQKSDKGELKGEVQEGPIKKIPDLGVVPRRIENVNVNEVINPITQEKILILDKTNIPDRVGPIQKIPNLRLVAKPASISSSANLLSEVTIKFKTI